MIDGGDSIARLQEAWDRVAKDPAVKSSLKQDARHTLSLIQRLEGNGIETTKFQHYYKGLEVIGSMALHHRGPKGAQISNQLAQFDLDTRPTLSPAIAVALTKSIVGDLELKSAPELKILPDASKGSARLVYWLEMQAQGLNADRKLIIDAHSGKVIANLSSHLTIAPVSVLSASGKGVSIVAKADKTDPAHPKLAGCAVTDLATHVTKNVSASQCRAIPSQNKGACQVLLDGDPLLMNPGSCTRVIDQNVDNGRADDAARRALANSQAVLNYYHDHHGRDSYDGNGGELVNIVHVGAGMDNAFWNTANNTMSYGDGDGKEFGDFTLGLDVAGHEMTHGLTEATAKLLMMDENGALNEAYSDFFGKLIANDGDWVLGKEVFLNPAPGQGIRNIADPASLQTTYIDDNGNVQKVPYPTQMSEKLTTSATCDSGNDNCWVHANSTIPSHASYLVIQALGKQDAERLYFATLTQYLTSTANFKDARDQTLKACSQLFDDSTCGKVQDAFAQVGL